MKPVRLGLWVPLLAGLGLLLVFGIPSCARLHHAVSRSVYTYRGDAPHGPNDILVTAYCNCGICCSWRPRYWFFGDPVHARGTQVGLPKDVGRTASGKYASRGTVAADPKVFPFGTRLDIPGYGIGRVEDTGGAIKGCHIDVWFPTHDEALEWGARWLPVRVFGKQLEKRASADPVLLRKMPDGD